MMILWACLGEGSLELGVATTLEEGEDGGWSSVWQELEQNQQVIYCRACLAAWVVSI